MIKITDEYRHYAKLYYEKFEKKIPVFQLPENETTESMIQKIKESIESDIDLLYDLYHHNKNDNKLY